jgi:uncharacterized protein YecT (DUF1311 family)
VRALAPSARWQTAGEDPCCRSAGTLSWVNACAKGILTDDLHAALNARDGEPMLPGHKLPRLARSLHPDPGHLIGVQSRRVPLISVYDGCPVHVRRQSTRFPCPTTAAGAASDASLPFPMALLSVVDSTPRAYRLKAGNALGEFQRRPGHPRGKNHSCIAFRSRSLYWVPTRSAGGQIDLRGIRYLVVGIIPLCLALSGSVRAASFGCSGSLERVERLICADSALSAFDDDMARVYAEVRLAAKDPIALRDAQRGWIKARNACVDRYCVEMAYRKRIAQLNGSVAPVAGLPPAPDTPTRPAGPAPRADDEIALPPLRR